MNLEAAKTALLGWYEENKRPLPWRADRDAYRIWISETMLQQTTTTAVIPYFERFLTRFPTLQTLSDAPETAVLEAWAGLGYYSRARNLHKSARALHARGGFPRTHVELLELPGFGPYTARAVASLAFDEAVGVVDGNVIRVLARVDAADWEWWRPKTRQEIQDRVDAWVAGVSPYAMNQALMELGRTVCTPKSPSCLLCPLRPHCAAFAADAVARYPRPKPRREREIWHWEARLSTDGERVLITRNREIPFLHGQWMLPGPAARLSAKPSRFDFKHTITHHDIYVTVKEIAPPRAADDDDSRRWVKLKEIRQYAPTSLVDKVVRSSHARRDRDADDDDAGLPAPPRARNRSTPQNRKSRRDHDRR